MAKKKVKPKGKSNKAATADVEEEAAEDALTEAAEAEAEANAAEAEAEANAAEAEAEANAAEAEAEAEASAAEAEAEAEADNGPIFKVHKVCLQNISSVLLGGLGSYWQACDWNGEDCSCMVRCTSHCPRRPVEGIGSVYIAACAERCRMLLEYTRRRIVLIIL